MLMARELNSRHHFAANHLLQPSDGKLLPRVKFNAVSCSHAKCLVVWTDAREDFLPKIIMFDFLIPFMCQHVIMRTVFDCGNNLDRIVKDKCAKVIWISVCLFRSEMQHGAVEEHRSELRSDLDVSARWSGSAACSGFDDAERYYHRREEFLEQLQWGCYVLLPPAVSIVSSVLISESMKWVIVGNRNIVERLEYETKSWSWIETKSWIFTSVIKIHFEQNLVSCCKI